MWSSSTLPSNMSAEANVTITANEKVWSQMETSAWSKYNQFGLLTHSKSISVHLVRLSIDHNDNCTLFLLSERKQWQWHVHGIPRTHFPYDANYPKVAATRAWESLGCLATIPQLQCTWSCAHPVYINTNTLHIHMLIDMFIWTFTWYNYWRYLVGYSGSQCICVFWFWYATHWLAVQFQKIHRSPQSEPPQPYRAALFNLENTNTQ